MALLARQAQRVTPQFGILITGTFLHMFGLHGCAEVLCLLPAEVHQHSICEFAAMSRCGPAAPKAVKQTFRHLHLDCLCCDRALKL